MEPVRSAPIRESPVLREVGVLRLLCACGHTRVTNRVTVLSLHAIHPCLLQLASCQSCSSVSACAATNGGNTHPSSGWAAHPTHRKFAAQVEPVLTAAFTDERSMLEILQICMLTYSQHNHNHVKLSWNL